MEDFQTQDYLVLYRARTWPPPRGMSLREGVGGAAWYGRHEGEGWRGRLKSRQEGDQMGRGWTPPADGGGSWRASSGGSANGVGTVSDCQSSKIPNNIMRLSFSHYPYSHCAILWSRVALTNISTRWKYRRCGSWGLGFRYEHYPSIDPTHLECQFASNGLRAWFWSLSQRKPSLLWLDCKPTCL